MLFAFRSRSIEDKHYVSYLAVSCGDFGFTTTFHITTRHRYRFCTSFVIAPLRIYSTAFGHLPSLSIYNSRFRAGVKVEVEVVSHHIT